MRQLGSRYLLESRIGVGGMGEVWSGVDANSNPFAFKLLLPQFTTDTELVKRFVAERQVLTSVQHPNIVGVHDLVIEGSTLAIVMDLVNGIDLRRYLDAVGTLPPQEACRLGAQLASALEAMHAHKIVHRDVKPSNTLLDTSAELRVRLSDFGLARLIDDAQSPQHLTVMAGTPLYMAPEVLNGACPTPQSDLYALGMVLYEMLVGHAPFAGLATGPLMQAHMNLDPGRVPGISDALWQVIMVLLQKDPKRRPPNAGVVAARLEYLAQQAAGQPRIPKPQQPPKPVPSANPAPAVNPVQPAGPITPPTEAIWPVGKQTPPRYEAAPQQPASPQPIGGFAPVETAAPALPPEEPRRKGRVGLMLFITVLLVLASGALAAVVVVQSLNSRDTAGASSSSSAAGSNESPSATPSGKSEPPATPRSPSSSPSVEAQFPPTGATLCEGSANVAVNEVTSCEFALNVAADYQETGGGIVTSFSPATEQWYDMLCEQQQPGVVICTGGNGAAVYILD